MIRIEAILDGREQTKSSVTFTVEVDECKPTDFTLIAIPDQSLTVEDAPYTLGFGDLSPMPCTFELNFFTFL